MEPLEIFPAEGVFFLLYCVAAAVGYEFEDESPWRALGCASASSSFKPLWHCEYSGSSDDFPDFSFTLMLCVFQSITKIGSCTLIHVHVVLWPVDATQRPRGYPRAVWAHLSSMQSYV